MQNMVFPICASFNSELDPKTTINNNASRTVYGTAYQLGHVYYLTFTFGCIYLSKDVQKIAIYQTVVTTALSELQN